MDTKPKTKLDKRKAAIIRQRAAIKTNKLVDSAKLRQSLALPSLQSPEQAASQLDRRCPYCGTLLIPRIEVYQMPMRPEPHRMFIWSDLHGCPQEAEGLRHQALRAEMNEAEVQEQLRQSLLVKAGLVGWLAEASFDHFQPRLDWPGAMECKIRALSYFDALRSNDFETAHHPLYRPHKKNWLVMHGHYGNGKTLLAAAMVKHYGHNSYFRVWPDYERRIRASYGGKDGSETEADIIEELQKGDFVVIDDLDKRKGTDFTRGVLYSVLNYRYNAELPTALTFNYGPGDVDPKAPGRLMLEEFLGTAVLDRIIGSAFDVIEFTGPSYRSGVRLEPAREGGPAVHRNGVGYEKVMTK